MQVIGNGTQICDTFPINITQSTLTPGSNITTISDSNLALLFVNLTLQLTCLDGFDGASCQATDNATGGEVDTMEKIVLRSMVGVAVLVVISVGLVVILGLVRICHVRRRRGRHVITYPHAKGKLQPLLLNKGQ